MRNKYKQMKHSVVGCAVTRYALMQCAAAGLTRRARRMRRVCRRHLPTAAQLSTITFLQTHLDKPVVFAAPPAHKSASPARRSAQSTRCSTPVNLRIADQPWALKNPTGNSPRTLQRAFRDAARRADNIIIDLGNTDLPDAAAIAQLQQLFAAVSHVQNLLIVTSTAELLEYHK